MYKPPYIIPTQSGTKVWPQTTRTPLKTTYQFIPRPGMTADEIGLAQSRAMKALEKAAFVKPFYLQASHRSQLGAVPYISCNYTVAEGIVAKYTHNYDLERLDVRVDLLAFIPEFKPPPSLIISESVPLYFSASLFTREVLPLTIDLSPVGTGGGPYAIAPGGWTNTYLRGTTIRSVDGLGEVDIAPWSLVTGYNEVGTPVNVKPSFAGGYAPLPYTVTFAPFEAISSVTQGIASLLSSTGFGSGTFYNGETCTLGLDTLPAAATARYRRGSLPGNSSLWQLWGLINGPALRTHVVPLLPPICFYRDQSYPLLYWSLSQTTYSDWTGGLLNPGDRLIQATYAKPGMTVDDLP